MFCKNCGNRLGDDDKVCSVCGESVEPKSVTEESENRDRNDAVPTGTDDIKTPLFDFKWNIQDFPNEEKKETEDIDFKWEKPKDVPLVKKMQEAVDPDEIANTPTFSEDEEADEPITDEWYEPFSMKKTEEDETLFKFNKRNEEFQELLDKELVKYSNSKMSTIPIDATKKYHIEDFREEVSGLDVPAEPVVSDESVTSIEPVAPIEPATPIEPVIPATPKAPTPEQVKDDAASQLPRIAGLAMLNTSFASPIGDEAAPPKVEEIKAEVPKETAAHVKSSEFALIDNSFASPFAKGDDGADKATFKIAADTFDPGSKSIDEDEFLKDLPPGDGKSFTGAQKIADQDKRETPKQVIPEEPKKQKIIGPEIVNEPVVFPFELEDDEPEAKAVEQKKEETVQVKPPVEEPAKVEVKGPEKTEPHVNTAAKADEPAKVEEPQKPVVPVTPTASVSIPKNDVPAEEPKAKRGNKLITFLIVMIVIILILLGGIMVMKMAPNSGIGIMLNNLTESVLGVTGSANSGDTDTPKIVAPSQDYEALIKSQQSENRNIKEFAYGDDIGYDEKASYKIVGANNSQPIENNFWKTSKNGDILFDQQAVKTVIGFNSAWVDYLNSGDRKVFDYVVTGSEAEKVLEKEKLPKDSKAVQYDILTIGEIRQNGNKFYVWTKEEITIINKDGTKKNPTIKQLYELETKSDELLITTYVAL